MKHIEYSSIALIALWSASTAFAMPAIGAGIFNKQPDVDTYAVDVESKLKEQHEPDAVVYKGTRSCRTMGAPFGKKNRLIDPRPDVADRMKGLCYDAFKEVGKDNKLGRKSNWVQGYQIDPTTKVRTTLDTEVTVEIELASLERFHDLKPEGRKKICDLTVDGLIRDATCLTDQAASGTFPAFKSFNSGYYTWNYNDFELTPHLYTPYPSITIMIDKFN